VTVTGGFIPGDVSDEWTYNASAGEAITIRAEQTAGNGSLGLKLMTSDGTLLTTGSVSTSGAEIPKYVFSSPGTYDILLEAALDETTPLEYRLTLEASQAAVLSSMESASGIAYGETQRDVFPADNLYQAWVFYGHSGERIASSVVSHSGEGLSLYLVDPGGEILIADVSLADEASIANFLLTETGFYGLVISGQADTDYTVNLERLAAGAVVQGLLEGESTNELTAAAPVHEWEIIPVFAGNYLIQVVSLIPSTPLDVFVLSPEDTLLAAGSLEDSAITQVVARLETDKKYAAVVAGGQGHYKIRLAPAGGGTLESGVSGVGRINSEHFTEAWSLEGQLGQTLILDIARIQGNFTPLITIFDETGTALQETIANEDGSAAASLQLPGDGRYTVLVSRVGGGMGETWGDYSITARLE
jgi:hypothetical protein